MTTLFRPPLALDSLSTLPILAALAAAKTINSILGVRARVRWPNDIVVGDRKLAGVIVEAKFKGNQVEYALVGVGINANFHSDILGALGPASTSLEDLLGSPVDREEIITLLLMEIENVYDLASANMSGAMRLLKDFDCSRGRQVRIELRDEVVYGVITGYESFAKVQIKTTGGSCRLIETSAVISVDYVAPET